MFYRILICLLVLVSLPSVTSAQCQSASDLQAATGVCTVRLTWSRSPSAILQRLLRSTTANPATAVTIANLGPVAETHDDLPPDRGVSYFYWIQTTTFNCTQNSAGVSAILYTAAPAPVSVTPTCSGVEITGQSMFDATAYIAYRADSNGSNVVGFPQVNVPSFIDTTAVPGESYIYAMAPVGSCPGSGLVTGLLVDATGSPRISPPTTLSIATAGSSLTISPPVAVGPGATYRWTKDNFHLPTSDPRFSGLTSSTLTIHSTRSSDAGVYRLVVSHPCANASSDPILVSIRPGCRADFDENGSIAVADIFEFLNSWFAGCP